jgi:short-subunit dehydrogenase
MSKISKKLCFFLILSSFAQIFSNDLADCNERKPKKAIIIGASSGMGKEVAKRLSKSGYTVGLCARRLPLLESLQQELSNPSHIKQLDVTAADAREKLQELIAEMGGIDLIVISTSPYLDNRITASQNPVSGLPCDPLNYHHEQRWLEKSKNLNVCANGFIAMADVAIEHFKHQNSGHLVGISSTSGVRGGSGDPEYAAAKACIMTYMQGIRSYMIQKNINVYVTDIVPGYVAVEHSPLGVDPTAYWEITCEQAGEEIMAAIHAKKKVAVVPASLWILVVLRKYMPDFLYNRYFPWL